MKTFVSTRKESSNADLPSVRDPRATHSEAPDRMELQKNTHQYAHGMTPVFRERHRSDFYALRMATETSVSRYLVPRARYDLDHVVKETDNHRNREEHQSQVHPSQRNPIRQY